MNSEQIFDYLNNFELDVRKTHDGTWIDQKCTPDILCFVADCISHYVETHKSYSESGPVLFTIQDIWYTNYAVEFTQALFSKPSPIDDGARREYDKFFSQPIKLLNYAHVIRIVKRGRGYTFEVENLKLLEFIAARDRNAFIFLWVYITKVLIDTELLDVFEEFFSKQTEESLTYVKNKFTELMFNYTNRGSKGGDYKDCYRIFSKVLNPLAVFRMKKGTIRGMLSKNPLQYSELFYNRENFRDTIFNKPKNVARKDFIIPEDLLGSKEEYEIQKAKNNLRRYNERFNSRLPETSKEILGQFPDLYTEAQLNELTQMATEMHHIFPVSNYPEIAAYVENLIALTPNQHRLYAHPMGKTTLVDKTYQYYLLLCKFASIRESLCCNPSTIYTFSDYMYVLNIGLETEKFSYVPPYDYGQVFLLISEICS